MTLHEIKEKIKLLADKHQSIDEDDLDAFEDAEFLELEAEKLIVSYCEQNQYLINGFPTEKKKIEDELDEDYFCRERYQLYLDKLLVEKEDVAELMWCFTSSFWPDSFESKEYYIQCIKEQLESGVFYEVDLD
ncbi:MAG: hypothetical protein O9297_07315 [Flavobacterium sp.]|uniref:hypothetical protein n=1 Tax=Flavobacterium sp. TaxID=239 RepID=UPI0022CB1345|nr:hypothetical protein [Flavobacterium sp.]MCZ8297012.1 hypothetical protein [Flavobacterium sp.]